MATRIHKNARGHLYIEEWMDHLGVSDIQLAGRLGVSRQTVWKRCKEQHRLNPGKIQEIADALGIHVMQLWGPPERPSLDAIMDEASDDLRKKAAEMVSILMRTGT